MRIAIFAHSFISDWNHGNAHFLRGIASELVSRGNEVSLYEPADAWSLVNLVEDYGEEVIEDYQEVYPQLRSIRYNLAEFDIGSELEGVDLVIVHEWSEPELVRKIGIFRRKHTDCRILFHDTHHRSVTDPEAMKEYDLSNYDGVLAFGEIIRKLYIEYGWAKQAWTWHEAADVTMFKPFEAFPKQGDLVWVGNWGDGERSSELVQFLVNPVNKLNLNCCVYGVRYHEKSLKLLKNHGIGYAGWAPNYKVPEIFSRFKVTVHIPRRPYVEALPGIPTIRVFEALACGIPLISAPWNDCEGLFTKGEDYLVAENEKQMTEAIETLLENESMAGEMARKGLETILNRHTCAHRVDELMNICKEIGIGSVQETIAEQKT
ncbi:group 1 glycosyl transferase [Chitinispirillum alkaliphilum]|nr:group 1 glycosyl transferase [Chitinispirillum alkaliphilum]